MTSPGGTPSFRNACTFAGLLLGVATAAAAAPRWTLATPFGGSMATVAQAPGAPQTLYAAARLGRVFRSDDGGATWSRRSGVQGSLFTSFLVDPQDPETVYAQTNHLTLLRTRDGARTWSEIDPADQAVLAVALDAGHPGVLFAAAGNGLYRSADGGDTWDLAAFGGSFVIGVAIDPRNTSTLWAAIGGVTLGAPTVVWTSTDRGATWSETTLTETPQGILVDLPRFAFDPVRPGTLYVLFHGIDAPGPVYRSTDGGASWALLPVALGVRDLVAAPDGVLFAATEFGVERSSDRGDTWVLSPPADDMAQVAVSGTPGELWAAGRTGLWRTVNGGTSWAAANRGIVSQAVYDVAVTPSGPPTVIAVTGSGVFRSTDRGTTWTLAQAAYDGPQPVFLEELDPRRPRTVYGFGSDGQADVLLRSTTGGRGWSKLPVPYDCDLRGSLCDVGMSGFAVDPRHPDTLFVSGAYDYHLGGKGIFLLRSDDGFATSTALTPVPRLIDLIVDAQKPSLLKALTCTGFVQSKNGGTTWQTIGRGLPADLCLGGYVRPPLAVDPRDSQRIYAGTSSRGVFASTDGGATFRAMNRGLETAQIATLLIDPTDSTHLYAGVVTKGVFQWNEQQRKWLPLNLGLPRLLYLGGLALDPQNPSLLYATTFEEGIFRLDLADTTP